MKHLRLPIGNQERGWINYLTINSNPNLVFHFYFLVKSCLLSNDERQATGFKHLLLFGGWSEEVRWNTNSYDWLTTYKFACSNSHVSIRSINNGALFGGRCEETREHGGWDNSILSAIQAKWPPKLRHQRNSCQILQNRTTESRWACSKTLIKNSPIPGFFYTDSFM